MGRAAAELNFCEHFDSGELVKLPLSMLMATIFIGGNKGAGKTSALKRLYEAAHAAGAQCVGIAPLGKWWSLRIGRNGRGPGLKGVVVFGGKNGDVPLLANAGAQIARVVVHKRLACVLDVEQMRKNERALFLGDFFEELMQLKKAEAAPAPMVVFIDEAQAIAPQKSSSKELERLRDLMGDFCRECRNYGAGLVLGAQRSANVDKDLLALAEMLLVMRTVHHIDRDVYRKWVDEKGNADDDEGAWLRRLRRLEKGEGYLYAPELNVFERVKCLLPATFDATKTATIGAKVARVGKLSKLDVRKLGEELATVIETATANDPVKLRGQRDAMTADNQRLTEVVRSLRAQLEKRTAKPDKRTLHRVERAAKDGRKVMHIIENSLAVLSKAGIALNDARASFCEGAKLLDVHGKLPVTLSATPVLLKAEARHAEKAQLFSKRYSAPPSAVYEGAKTKYEGAKAKAAPDGEFQLMGKMHSMLGALAGRPRPVPRAELFTLIGMSPGGGANNYVRALIANGYVDESPNGAFLTEKGRAEVKASFPLDYASVLARHHLMGKMNDMMQMVRRDNIVESRAKLFEMVGMAQGGGANNYVRHLLRLGLIEERSDGALVLPVFLTES